MISVSEISQRLADQAESLCKRFLPGGKMHAGEWLCGSLSGEQGESLKVQLNGPHAGSWRDWATNEHGDMLDLWRMCKGITQAEAIREAKDSLGIRDAASTLEQRNYAKPDPSSTKELTPGGQAVRYLTDKRKLEPSILNRFRVVAEPDRAAIAFPCYSPRGELINRSYRTLPKTGEKKKVWQDKGCAPALFGWQAVSDRAYKDRAIILCEGQIDAMTWAQWGFDALSIPNGSGQTWIAYEWENLQAFDTLYVCFDTDGPGLEIARKAIARLGVHRCLVVRLPCKDANDCLLAGHTAEDAAEWIAAAEAPKLDRLVRVAELRDRILAELAPKPEYYTLPFLRPSKFDPESGYQPRPGEVTLWTGKTGDGKSTVLNSFALGFLTNGIPTFVCSPEMPAEKLTARMLRSFFGKVGTEHVDHFLREVGQELIFADVMGYIQQDRLFEMMRFSFQRYGATQHIIDSLMRVEGLEEDFPAQGDFMNKLQEFTKSTGCHVHLVAHPRKVHAEQRLTKLDVKGSSLIPNNADNIVCVIRNQEKKRLKETGEITAQQEREMHDTEISIEKQRETGWEGSIKLQFDKERYNFTLMEPKAVTVTNTKNQNAKR